MYATLIFLVCDWPKGWPVLTNLSIRQSVNPDRSMQRDRSPHPRTHVDHCPIFLLLTAINPHPKYVQTSKDVQIL